MWKVNIAIFSELSQKYDNIVMAMSASLLSECMLDDGHQCVQ